MANTTDELLNNNELNIKKTNKFLLIFIVLLLGLVIIVIIFSIFRGFDFSDEGGYLLSYKNTNLYQGGIYNYHIIISNLTGFLNPGIKAYRWMTIITNLLSSSVLAFGLYKWLKSNNKKTNVYLNFIFIFSFVAIGNTLCASGTINNNRLTNIILQVVTGLILYLCSFDILKLIEPKRVFILSTIGFLCVYCFFIKFSTGIFQLTSYFMFFLIYSRGQSSKFKSIVIISIILGAIIGFLSYFSFFQSFSEWVLNYKKEYVMLSDHTPGFLINRYYRNFISFFQFSLLYYSWLLVFPIFILLKNHFPSFTKFKYYNSVINFSLLLSIFIFLYEIYYFKLYRSNFAKVDWINAYLLIIIITFQICLLAIFELRNFRKNSIKIFFNRIFIIILLLVTPFFGAIGTANPIFLNASIHSALWFCTILILIVYLNKYIHSKLVLSLFIIIPSIVTASQVIDSNTFTPYHSVFFNKNKANQFQQTEKVNEIPLLDGILIDIETKMFLVNLHKILKDNNFKKGYPIFGFHIPGVVYLMNGTSPGMPYFYNKERDIKAFECFNIKNNSPVILVTEDIPIKEDLLLTMKSRGVNFPNDYLLKGEVYLPNTKSMLKVYFPKNYNLQQLY